MKTVNLTSAISSRSRIKRLELYGIVHVNGQVRLVPSSNHLDPLGNGFRFTFLENFDKLADERPPMKISLSAKIAKLNKDSTMDTTREINNGQG